MTHTGTMTHASGINLVVNFSRMDGRLSLMISSERALKVFRTTVQYSTVQF